MEPSINYELDFGEDEGSEGSVEFYDVIYPVAGSGDASLPPGAQETLADFVKLLERGRPSDEASTQGNQTPASDVPAGTKVIEITIPGAYSSVSRLLDSIPRPHAPDLSSLDDLNSLKISAAEEEDRYHEELIKSALGPRGASIFQSPTLSPSPSSEEPVESSLTGKSSCAQCGRKCKLAQRFECKCGKTFCPQHRYYDQHACTFDFQAKDRKLVEKANPKVVKPKIEKI
jgi:hypothetical protein